MRWLPVFRCVLVERNPVKGECESRTASFRMDYAIECSNILYYIQFIASLRLQGREEKSSG